MNSDSLIEIVGGSLTGPALALMLRRARYTNVTITEADPNVSGKLGGALGLAPATIAILDELGIPPDEIVDVPSERVVHVKTLTGTSTTTIYAGRTVSWNKLHSALVRRLPRGPLWGKRYSTSDPHTRRAELVVFADGRTSTGRQIYDPHRIMRYAGYVAFRGISDTIPANLSGIADFTRWDSDDRGSQVNVFPIVRPDGRMGLDWTIYVDCPVGRYMTLFGKQPNQLTFAAVRREHRRYLLARCAALPRELSELVRMTTHPWMVPILDIDPPERAVFPGPAVLLGDALAPVRPHTGRGTNNGIQQAHALAHALRAHLLTGSDLAATLASWENDILPPLLRDLALGPKLAREAGLGVS